MNIRESFRSVFDSDYCGADEFIAKVIKPIFGEKDVEVLEPCIENPTNADEEVLKKANIEEVLWIATVDRMGTDPIQVFDITLGDSTNLSRARVGIQRIIRSALFPYSHAFLIFHHRVLSGTEWRFSYVYKQDKNVNTTDAKRYTYLFSRELHARTAIDRFEELAKSNKDNDALLTAFNVEALSDEFFKKYRAYYAELVKYITGKEYLKEGGKYVEKSTGTPDAKLYAAFGKDDKAVRDYVKKLMGRITFLHFLQRKGWMNSDKNYMLHLFENSRYKADYMDKVLEPLFFGILNTKVEDRYSLFKKSGWDLNLLDEWKSIPYLNGGLFEQEPFDCKNSVFPKDYFARLFQFFSEYNFTVDENDPDDAEVGVDPEMLGKIFENLLEDNKDKGAFYTPKEIVRYMCRESLVAYLLEKTGIDEVAIRDFVTNPYEKEEQMEWADKETILTALENVKICDPAIGSGAFPMGLLNELVRCEEAIVLGQEKNKGRAELKKSIIKNNIYGVDIEKGAIDIARLRFWLSLVVDEEEASPLPNLDYKIMQGNSLLESYKGMDLSHLLDGQDGLLNFGDDTRKSLKDKLDQYYVCEDHAQKKQLQSDINELVHQQIVDSGRVVKGFESIDVSANQEFFLWHTWFADVFSKQDTTQKGFDIVIGNPPYVLISKELYRLHYAKYFNFQEGKIDLYRLFIEFSIKLLHSHGCLTFITPNTFLSIKNCTKLRKYIIENCSLKTIINYDGSAFESASVNSIVFLLTNGIERQSDIQVLNENSIDTEQLSIPFSRIVESDQYEIPLNADSNSYRIKDLMIRNGVLLGHISDIEMCLGAQPYHNSIHTKEQMKAKFLHSDYQKNKSYVQDFGGKHFVRYYVSNENNRWVDYSAEFYTKPDIRFFNGPRIVIREIPSSTLICAYEERFKLFNKSVYILRSKQNDSFTLKFLLGVLNSKAIGYFISTFGDKSDQKIFPRISMSVLKSLPIPKAPHSAQQSIVSLVDIILTAKSASAASDTYQQEAEIDRIVYDLYAIPESERK